jgi:hypothetical protein
VFVQVLDICNFAELGHEACVLFSESTYVHTFVNKVIDIAKGYCVVMSSNHRKPRSFTRRSMFEFFSADLS